MTLTYNYYEHRLQQIKEALILLDGREDTKELCAELRSEQKKILDTIE